MVRSIEVGTRAVTTGTRALQTTIPTSSTTIEDWEGSTPLNNWEGETDQYSVVTSSPIEGSASVDMDGSGGSAWRPMGTSFTTTQGQTYRISLRSPSSTDGDPGMIIAVQDTSWPDSGLPDDCYFCRVNTSEPDMDINKMVSGVQSSVESAITVSSFTRGNDYFLELDWTTSNQLQCRLLESDLTQVGESSLNTDNSHTADGNFFGIVTGSGDRAITDLYQERAI